MHDYTAFMGIQTPPFQRKVSTTWWIVMKSGTVIYVPHRMNYDNLENALTFLQDIIRSNFETVGALW